MGACNSAESAVTPVVKTAMSMPTPTHYMSMTQDAPSVVPLALETAPLPTLPTVPITSTVSEKPPVQPPAQPPAQPPVRPPLELRLPGCGENGEDMVITYDRISAEMIRDVLSVRHPFPPVSDRHKPEFKTLVPGLRRSLSLYGSLMYARGPPVIPVYGPTCQLGQGYFKLIYDDEEPQPQPQAQPRQSREHHQQQPPQQQVRSPSPSVTVQDEAAVLEHQLTLFRSTASHSISPPGQLAVRDLDCEDAPDCASPGSVPRMDFLDELGLPLYRSTGSGSRATTVTVSLTGSVSAPELSLFHLATHSHDHMLTQSDEHMHMHHEGPQDAVRAKYVCRSAVLAASVLPLSCSPDALITAHEAHCAPEEHMDITLPGMML